MKNNLNELRDRAYKCACDHGFHDKELSDAHCLMLVITEISEAVEADRKNHIAKMMEYDECHHYSYPYKDEDFISDFERYIKDSISDELADVAIRLLDFAGLKNIDFYSSENDAYINEDLLKKSTFTESSLLLSNILMKGYNEPCGNSNSWIFNANKYTAAQIVYNSLNFVLKWCEYMQIDIFKHIELKMKYNELREHKHGKSY